MRTHQRTHKSWHKLPAADVDQELAASSFEDREISRPQHRKKPFLAWGPAAGPRRGTHIRAFYAPHFSAKGMRLIYGRGDHFTRLSCGMDMFLRKDGLFFVRFYSPGTRITYRSYQIVGLKLPPLPDAGKLLEDDCVPGILRDLYEDWTIECIEYPDDIT